MNDFAVKKYQGTLLKFLGPDGQDFLQRLISIDIKKVKEGDMVLSSFLDAKASVFSCFFIYLKQHSKTSLLVSDTYKNDVIEYIEKNALF